MRQITVVELVSLDGVFQAPGGADEDERGGCDRGGWARPYSDEVLAAKMAGGPAEGPGAMLFGRPHRTGPYAEALTSMTEHVVTTRPDETTGAIIATYEPVR